ncbi:uroporphyrin-3 C-methyltransferase [Kushneria sinocarnis]|uniref:Uroporphyrin-3 C-methyltransferase n=1 Tax=Kushneria sinocarnis TaxID=595502 RepID=A0A420X0T5_9GAMM|nr:uroporphyrinogen-III C-methyltransferase [Kushneria sinocarnis]RKR07463.1 uroporphyrin-3 C-methyltransferase [Kushneria sinocarnis]
MSSQEHDNDGNRAPNGGHDAQGGGTSGSSGATGSAASRHPGAAPESNATQAAAGTSGTDSSSTERAGAAADRGAGAKQGAGTQRTAAGGGGSGGSGSGRQRPNGGRPVMIGLLVVILIVLIGAIVWGVSAMNSQRKTVSQLQDRVATLAQTAQQAQQQVDSRQQRIGQLQSRLSETDDTLQRVLRELSSRQQQQQDSRQWVYAEIEYLLRMANQRLQLERDVAGATSLLSTADERLREIDNPALTPVRRALSSELSALDGVPDIDRTGLFLRFGALQERLAGMPLSQEVQALSAEPADESTFSGDWRSQLARLGSQLKDLVTVRRHDEPLQALITPDQEGYLRENIRLLLEQAQLGLLKQNEEVYRQSIARAEELIRGYFKTDDSTTRSVLDQLDRFSERNIRPQLPDISGSLNALRQFRQQRGGGEQGDSA